MLTIPAAFDDQMTGLPLGHTIGAASARTVRCRAPSATETTDGSSR